MASSDLPAARLIATVPALEVPRPDWPANAHVVGPLLWEPTDNVLALPPGDDPLVMVAPSTAFTGAEGMVETALAGLDGAVVRVAVSMTSTVISSIYPTPLCVADIGIGIAP